MGLKMSRNNAIFHVEIEGVDRAIPTDTRTLVILLTSKMWIRHYAEDGTCTILKGSAYLDKVNITSDEDFEELKSIDGRLVIIDMPFFTVFSKAEGPISGPIYSYDEALGYVNDYIQNS